MLGLRASMGFGVILAVVFAGPAQAHHVKMSKRAAALLDQYEKAGGALECTPEGIDLKAEPVDDRHLILETAADSEAPETPETSEAPGAANPPAAPDGAQAEKKEERRFLVELVRPGRCKGLWKYQHFLISSDDRPGFCRGDKMATWGTSRVDRYSYGPIDLGSAPGGACVFGDIYELKPKVALPSKP